MQIRPGVELAGLTDVGCQRENNEDNYSYWEPESEEQFSRMGRLAVVADGMGGYEGGQEASLLAVETVREVYSAARSGEPQTALRVAFETAHQRILEKARKHPELHGMGTTCTAAAVVGLHLYFAHVGDSRLYLLRDSILYRLTRDHSYVGRLVQNKLISPEEAESHPQRHILTAALGAGAEVVPDSSEQPLELKPGDVLALCTDGLWSVVSDDDIRQTVSGRDATAACKELVRLAKDHGGPDNITVQVLRIGAAGNGTKG